VNIHSNYLKYQSNLDRSEISSTSPSFSYCEIDYECFGRLLSRLESIYGVSYHTSEPSSPAPEWEFVDLGSGGGKLVFSAYFSGLFISCTGIEILPRLHKASGHYLKYFTHQIVPKGSPSPAIEFVLGDASFYDFAISKKNKTDEENGENNFERVGELLGGSTDEKNEKNEKNVGDEVGNNLEGGVFGSGRKKKVVFCLSTCFDRDLRNRLQRRASHLPLGSLFVSTTYSIVSPPFFELLEKFRFTMNEVGEETSEANTCDMFISRRVDSSRGGDKEVTRRVISNGLQSQIVDDLKHLEEVLNRDYSLFSTTNN
jgi:hypothetical protein